jgi:uroporphyrinogen decarboxylase
MEEMSGRNRISAAFKKTFSDQDPEIDRVPAYIFTGICNAQLIGSPMSELLLDPKVFVKAQVAAFERYKPDIMIMMRDLLMDVEALGNELQFPENSMCISKTEVLKEDKGRLGSLQLADPKKDGRIPDYLWACAETKEILSDAIVSAVIAGPWTIAMGLRGATELILDSMNDPDYVHELMTFCTQATIDLTEELAEIGVGIGYSEAPASCSLISPDMYREFVLPYHKQLVSHFQEKKVGVGLHICGNADPIIEDIVSTGASNVSIDSGTDMGRAVEATRSKTVLIGNVDTGTFMADSKEEMKHAVQNCIDLAPADSGYILAPGCEVPGAAPAEKIDWFMDLANELGTYH